MQPNQFKHRIVRDLAWVIASPPLLSGIKNNTLWLDHSFCLKEYADCLSALIKLDTDPQPLILQIEQLKSKRLGYRFESFINFWLKISPNYVPLAHNIQLIENKQTLGEVDFIIQNSATKEIIHLEVAVKFYLGTTPFENDFRWFGTNTNDQLGKKQQHLIEHQTQLIRKYPTLIKYKIDQRYCLVKGRLFYPFDTKTPDTPPNSATQNHLKGFWLKQNNSNQNKLKNKQLLYPLIKHEWLSSLQAAELKDKVSLTPLQKLDRAQCCISINDNNEEDERIFILPESFEFPDYQAQKKAPQ